MKRLIAVTTAILTLSFPLVILAMYHNGHAMDHTSTVAHNEVVDGVKVTFNVQTMADAMNCTIHLKDVVVVNSWILRYT